MDKNTITGFILIALVLVGFSWYSQPSDEEIAQMREEVRLDSIRQVKAENAKMAKAEAKAKQIAEEAKDTSSLFYESRNGKAQEVRLSNGLLNLTLNTRGGSISSATLSEYRNQQGGSVELLRKGQNSLSYVISGKDDNIDTRDYTFTPVGATDTTVTMRLGGDARHLDITYRLHTGSYLLDIDIDNQLGSLVSPTTKTMAINWQDIAAQQERGFDFEQRYSSLTYKKAEGGTDYLSETKEAEEQPEEALKWIAFKNQFFSCVLLTGDQFKDTSLKSTPQEKGSGDMKQYEASMNVPFDASGRKQTNLQLYLGPNDFHLLKEHDGSTLCGEDADLEELVYLGWPLFRWINRWFIMPLFDWLTGFGMNMGIVLLLLTLIVKALVYPTTKKSYLSSARMRVLKPQVDALSAKYPGQEDAMKKQAEMMQLYKEYGVSPMGGCLPMLIQMPIWIALFNFVPNAIELRSQSFLWAKDLSSYDELLHWNTDIWLIGDHLSIFCLLFSLTNIINTWISMRQQQNQMSGEQAQQMKMMQYMMYIMPLMFFFMFNNYSSGLCYYYFLSGLTSILIMAYLRKTTDDKKLLEKLEAYRASHKNEAKKTSGLAARLEAMQKMVEEQQKNKK